MLTRAPQLDDNAAPVTNLLSFFTVAVAAGIRRVGDGDTTQPSLRGTCLAYSEDEMSRPPVIFLARLFPAAGRRRHMRGGPLFQSMRRLH